MINLDDPLSVDGFPMLCTVFLHVCVVYYACVIATLATHRSVCDGDLQLLFPVSQQLLPQLSPSPQRLQSPVFLLVLSLLVPLEAVPHLLVDDLPRLTLPIDRLVCLQLSPSLPVQLSATKGRVVAIEHYWVI